MSMIKRLLNDDFATSQFNKYRARVSADGGNPGSRTLEAKLIRFYKSQGRWNDIKLLWSAVGGTLVQSGTNPLQVSKAYSADSNRNDLAQVTSLNQPYGVGQIQNIPSSLYKPNGSIKNMPHPEISFAADQEWCITIVFNYNGSSPVTNAYFLGKSGATLIGIWLDGTIVFYSGGGRYSTKKTNNFIGKNTILSFVYNGTPALKLYVNGEYWDAFTVPVNSFITDTLFVINTYSGSISHICLNQFASITASQVAAEHNLLRSIYPEINSVVIGSQEWAVDNFRAVATPMGNVIPNVTNAAAWAALTTPAWCSYNNDPANDAIYGKIFNGYAKNLLYADMVTALFGWNVATKGQLQSIAALGGDVLRVAGTGYWTTDRGNNSAQFYALGGAMRNADGSFATLKNSATFWACDAIEAMTIQHDSDTVTVAATDLKAGHSIRLTKL